MTTWRPTHAYVPGQSQRHAETVFDAIKATIHGIPHDRLHETEAWQLAHELLRDGYYWEAHEILEAIWMACPPNSAEKLLVQGLIQQANARLKGAMGMEKAQHRLEAQATRLIKEAFMNTKANVLGHSFDEFISKSEI
ncbi:MAG: DUF309 domain-containing protein [Pikeienuella sp.]